MDFRLEKVAQTLKTFDNIYFEPLGGNNGDKLIELGARKFLRTNNIILNDNIRNCDAVVVNGGGGMTDVWGALEIVENYIEGGVRNIIVLPSSFHVSIERMKKFSKLVRNNNCNLFLFARERKSFNRIIEFSNDGIKVDIDHDMAFFLDQQDVFQQWQGKRRKDKFALIVERRDPEASTGISRAASVPIPFKRMFPVSLRRPIKRILGRGVARSEFVELSKRRLMERKIERYVVGDVSDTSIYNFSQFLEMVTNAECVVSTRLHVAILRFILERECLLVPTGGSHKKNESIYEYSMCHRKNIELLYLSDNVQ